MRLRAACCRTRAGTTFYAQYWTIPSNALQAGKHVEHRSHIGRLFLHPDDVGTLAVAIQFSHYFFLGERVHLFEEHDRGAGVFPLLPFGLEFMADFSRT